MLSGDHGHLFSSSSSGNTKIKTGAGKGRAVAGGRQKCLLRCQLLEETRLAHSQEIARALLEFFWGFWFLGFAPPKPFLLSHF